MTNYKKIKNMSVEEMAEYIQSITACSFCPLEEGDCENCHESLKEWLKSEAEETE